MSEAASSPRTPLGVMVAPPRLGEHLQPSSVGVCRDALNFYLQRERDFIDVYFPEVSGRGYATWADVFGLSPRQADALRPIMSESIRHFWKQDGRERNRNTNLLTRERIDPDFISYFARKASYWTDALRDVCRVFGLASPV